MLNLLRVEQYKLIKNKVFWVLVSIIVAVTLLSVFLFFLEEKGIIEATEDEGFIIIEVNEDETEPLQNDGISFFMDTIYGPDWSITVLLISVLGAFMIATENSNGTIKNTVSIGYRRREIYFSKLAVFSIASIALYIFIAVAFGVFASLFWGIGNIPPMEEFILIGKIVVLSSLYLISFASIVMLFSVNVKGSGLAILISFPFFLLFGPFLTLLGQKYILFEKVNHYSVYYRFMTIVESDLNQIKVLLELITIPVITSMIFIILGMITFQKKDIQ